MLKIGHRGAPGFPPREQNTIQSFEKAFLLKADGIECDVRRSADGIWFLHHEPAIKGRVISDTTFNVLSKLQELSMLDNLFVWAKNRPRIIIVLDVKIRNYLKELCGLIKNSGIADRLIFSSFHHFSLPKVKMFLPEIKTAMIIGSFRHTFFIEGARAAFENLPLLFKHDLIIKRAKQVGVSRLHLSSNLISDEIINRARKAGLEVFVWTVNEQKEMDEFEAMGIDGVFTDFPGGPH